MSISRKRRISAYLNWILAYAEGWRINLPVALAVTIFGMALIILSGCNLRTPPVDNPPGDSAFSGMQGIEKSFFVDRVESDVVVEATKYDEKGRVAAPEKREKRTIYKPKTFLCGWAPITEQGWVSQEHMNHGVNMADHCNVEFEITEKSLVGKLVNPSFPTDRTRWKTAVVIPITKHYYVEKKKDSYGRDTTEDIKNDQRSDWTSRPLMDLDLAGIYITEPSYTIFFDHGVGVKSSISDIEWDLKSNFLGFTLEATSPKYGSDHGARVRFNFLAFKHNPDFKQTPYHVRNSKHLNALHLIGEKVEGITPILYAAHWDPYKKHKIYLHGFDDKLIPIARRTVDAYNDVFSERLGLPRPFELSTENANKYGFDLRYPSIVYVKDRSIQLNGTLGIGTALTDVRNGEILWGNVTVYGGQYESYIKSFLPAGDISRAKTAANQSRHLEVPPLGTGFFSVPQNLFSSAALKSLDLTPASHTTLARYLEQGREGQGQKLADNVVTELEQVTRAMQMKVDSSLASRPVSKILGFQSYERGAAEKAFGAGFDKMSPDEIRQSLFTKASESARGKVSGVVFDTDRKFMDVAPGWAAAITASKGKLSYDEAFDKAISDVFLHEFGHIIGLGHQFKENILPEPGTVPDRILNSLIAKAKKNMTNATSIMGYKSPLTEMAMERSDIAPGPQDELVLRYLYKQEYATFKAGEADFKYFPVPKNGIIPASAPNDPARLTSYFPQCNDYQASLSHDPYCNRHDRGYDAETITKSYLEDLNASLISKIYAFADVRGGNPDMATNYLWARSLREMGRVRLFYDYMRQKYADQIQSIASDERALFEFSRACAREIEASPKLAAMFFKRGPDGKNYYTELGQLCRANKKVVEELTNFIVNPGPDRTRMDWDNNYAPASMTGGDAEIDTGHLFGTYTALGVLPLKLSAMNALTTPMPYMTWGPWLMPIPRYTDEQGLFAYSSLYPFEFTKAVAKGVEKNLEFGTRESPRTTMGEPVLALGYFLSQMNQSNDSIRFPKDFIDTIRTQSNFRLSLVAVIMKMHGREKDTPYITHFETDIFDFRSGRSLLGSQSFILPGGKVIIKGPNRSFVYPITKFQFLNDKEGIVFAYRIDFDEKFDDVLAAHSAKNSLKDLHDRVIKTCFYGEANNGLASFFNRETLQKDFPGFEAFPGISNDKEMQLRFIDSVQQNYNRYYEFVKSTPNPPGPEVCEQSLKGLGLIVTAAAAVSGFWLPETFDYMVK